MTINRLVQDFKVSRVLGAIAEIGLADHLPADAPAWNASRHYFCGNAAPRLQGNEEW